MIAIMSKNEILQELTTLSPQERSEIRARIAELDGVGGDDDGLTPEEEAIVEKRIADVEKNPGKFIPWSQAKARLKARYGE